MLQTFLATLQPLLVLFLCIAVGFIAHKGKVLPENTDKVMAKLELWIFCPALSLATQIRYCTIDTIATNATNMIFAIFCVALSLAIAIPLSKLFVREDCYERGVYQYALAFANLGYMGDPLVQALFGDAVLALYKLFTLPLTVVIYTWGINVLTPKEYKRGNPIKSIFNFPMICMLIGMVIGLCGLGGVGGFMDSKLPFFMNTLDTLKACMGPVAMLLVGFKVASYDLGAMLKNKKIYIATLLRLVVLPAIIVAFIFGVKELGNLIFNLDINNNVLFLVFFAVATPLGMNTVVFPEAYGGDPKTGAAMAMISHTLCVITIPLMFALMSAIFGVPIWA